MIYLIDMFNVEFLIFVRNETEKYIMDIWWDNFISTLEMGRVSVVLDFLKRGCLDFEWKWKYCPRLSIIENIRAWIGFRKQLKEFFK